MQCVAISYKDPITIVQSLLDSAGLPDNSNNIIEEMAACFNNFIKVQFDNTGRVPEPPAFLPALILEPQHNHTTDKKTGKCHQLQYDTKQHFTLRVLFNLPLPQAKRQCSHRPSQERPFEDETQATTQQVIQCPNDQKAEQGKTIFPERGFLQIAELYCRQDWFESNEQTKRPGKDEFLRSKTDPGRP